MKSKTKEKKEQKNISSKKILLKEKPKKDKNKDKDKEKEKEEEAEEIPQPKPKIKNIERYIYISSYSDSSLMSTLKQLFEEINQKAFNLSSNKEVNTYELSPEEQDNNEIDYISGVQVLDKNIRITILEGITQKGLQKVKEFLPKTKLNDNNIKILMNSEYLFDTRIYSKFGLSLKLIKLQHNLNDYLQTYNIYENANKFRKIYDCFQNFGSLLRVETMEEVVWYGLFPDAESLLLLEKKYGDLLTHQDITGIYKERKKIVKISMKDFINSDNSNTLSNNNIHDSNRDLNDLNINSKNSNNDISDINNNSGLYNNNAITEVKNDNRNKKIIHISKSQGDINKNKNIFGLNDNLTYEEKLKIIHKLILKPKTDSKNKLYEKYLEEKKHKNVSKSQIWNDNFKYIESLKQKIPTCRKFCRPCLPGEEIIERPKEILFGPTRINYFDSFVKKMREKYRKDTKHYYSYSNYSLALSFPMIDPGRNEKYLNYVENKKKWINKKDFERYKQPEREKIYFPKIKNIL